MENKSIVYIYLCMIRFSLVEAFLMLLSFYRLEPLLARIKEDRRNVLCPIVDAVMDDTLEYSKNGGYQVGGFTWSMHYTWRDVPEQDRTSRQYTDPVR